jgi:DNA-binding Lrp family transcriptional regulator/ferredoxin
LRVDEETIRRRILKLEGKGVIERYALMPNPQLLGRKCAAVLIEVPNGRSKEELFRKLEATEGISVVHSFHGSLVLAYLLHPKKTPSSEAVSKLESAIGLQSKTFWESKLPKFELSLTRADWMILAALRADPRSKLIDVAKWAGISSRTLTRRLDRMIAGNAFTLETMVNLEKIGSPSVSLFVNAKEGKEKLIVDEEVYSRLASSTQWSDTSSDTISIYSIVVDNHAEARRIFEQIESLRGVGRLRMEVEERCLLADQWVDEFVSTKIPGVQKQLKVLRPVPKQYRPRPRVRSTPKRPPRTAYTWTGSVIDGRNVRIRLESDLCMGTASCVELAPKVFRLDWTKKKSIFDPGPLEVLRKRVKGLDAIFLAAQSCPYRAIKLDDADTDEQLFP